MEDSLEQGWRNVSKNKDGPKVNPSLSQLLNGFYLPQRLHKKICFCTVSTLVMSEDLGPTQREDKRLFVCLTLPQVVKETLSQVQVPLPGFRWTPPDNLHFTLKFIGEVDAVLEEKILKTLAPIRIEPFILSVKGMGCFSSRLTRNRSIHVEEQFWSFEREADKGNQ